MKPNDEILRSNGKLDTIDFDSIDARYVKFQGVERRPVGDTKYGYSIYELEVYGDDLMVSYNETVHLAEQLLALGKGDPALRGQLLAMLDRYPYQFESVAETLKDLVSRLKASIEEKPTDPGAPNGGTTASGGGGNAGGGGATANVDEAELSLTPGKPGTLTLGDRVTIQIPRDAVKTPARLRIHKLLDPGPMMNDKVGAISPAYELTLIPGGSFEKEVRMSISFDSRNLKADQKACIFFYEPSSKKWAEVGGTVSASIIQADVMKTGIYAVFAVVNGVVQPNSSSFTDTPRHWAAADIEKAVQLGIVTGYPDGSFRPGEKVTRAEFAAMLARVLKLHGSGSSVAFKDAGSIGDWAREAIAQAVNAGIVNGYEDGTFRPNAFIQRDEMVAMIARALNLETSRGGKAKTAFADDATIPAWAKNAIQVAVLQGLIQGRSGNLFAANETATRAEAVTIMLKAAEYNSR